MDQTTAAPGTHDTRPPVVVSAPHPGAAASLVRTTARQRAIITPIPWETTDPTITTYPTNHPYVRRYWTATIGPGAVADLRDMLFTAASRTHQKLVPYITQSAWAGSEGQVPKCLIDTWGRCCGGPVAFGVPAGGLFKCLPPLGWLSNELLAGRCPLPWCGSKEARAY
jgi:hypothetical protein